MTHLPIVPILIPLAAAALALLLPARSRGIFATAAMGVSLAVSIWLLTIVAATDQAQVFHSGGWTVGGVPFGIVLVADWLAALFVVMSQLVLLLGFVYALHCGDAVIGYPTFYPLFLLLATGLSGALLTGDLFNLFVFAELLVIAGAVLTAASDDRFGVEAAFKYFYMSLLAAAFLLFACGLLYSSYGTLNMAQLSSAVSNELTAPAALAAGLLLATFMVKSAAMPFHFWQPDFHAAAPTPVSAVLSSVVVKLGVYGFLRMTTLLFVEQGDVIRTVLLVAGVAGVIFGGLAAVGTHNLKRMLAYSTLAQVGLILVGIGWGTPASIAAALIFAFNHALIKSAMLMLAGALASRAVVKSADFSNLTALGHAFPGIGALFLLGALALAGIPPTNGFVSKFVLFDSALAAGRFVSLAIVGMASLLTLVYTMRALMRIWWAPGAMAAKGKQGDGLLAPVLLIGGAVLLGFWAEPLVAVASETAAWLTVAENYVGAVLGSAVVAR